tara:strand:+ start:284 stop:793 length:510 start_codon:yes stop_codon:yes gene_type:complete
MTAKSILKPTQCGLIEIDNELLLPIMLGELDGKQVVMLTLEKPEGIEGTPRPTDKDAIEVHWERFAQRAVVFERGDVGRFRVGVKPPAEHSKGIPFEPSGANWVREWLVDYKDGAALIGALDHVLTAVVEIYVSEYWGEWREVEITGASEAVVTEIAKKVINWNAVGEA